MRKKKAIFKKLGVKLLARITSPRNKRRLRILGICAAVALVLALMLRFGGGMYLGGRQMAEHGTYNGRSETAVADGAKTTAPAKPAPESGGQVADNLAAGNPAAGGEPSGRLNKPVPPARSFSEIIVPRSLFDSSMIDAQNAEPTVNKGPVKFDPFGDCQKTDLSLTVLGTIEAIPMDRGTALLQGGENSKEMARVYQVGDNITNDSVLWAVYRRKVFLRRNDGSIECVTLGEEPKRKPRPAAASTDKKEPSEGGAHEYEGITKVSETEYEISADEIAYAMSNVDQLSRDARITQYYKDGQRSGFRLSSLRRNGVFFKLGMRNNDVITSINGSPITSTDQALKLYQSMQSDKEFKVEVLRRGQPTTIQYSVR